MTYEFAEKYVIFHNAGQINLLVYSIEIAYFVKYNDNGWKEFFNI